jgi:hypothetical protein
LRRRTSADPEGKGTGPKEKRFGEKEYSLALDEKKVRELIYEQKRQLEVVSGMTAEEAKRQFLKQD